MLYHEYVSATYIAHFVDMQWFTYNTGADWKVESQDHKAYVTILWSKWQFVPSTCKFCDTASDWKRILWAFLTEFLFSVIKILISHINPP